MNRSTLAPLLVALMLLLGACASAPTPTPTPTPRPTLAPLPCPSEYDPYVDSEIGFSACYPTGWQASKYEDSETKVLGVDFVSPTQESDPVAKRISVRVAPVSTDSSEEDLLESFVLELMNRRSVSGREVGPIAAIVVDGRKAVEDTQEGTVFSGGQSVQVSGWVAGFPAHQKMWYIAVNGPSESASEVEAIYREFLSQFHLVPRP
jgi:hypothetical protein